MIHDFKIVIEAEGVELLVSRSQVVAAYTAWGFGASSLNFVRSMRRIQGILKSSGDPRAQPQSC